MAEDNLLTSDFPIFSNENMETSDLAAAVPGSALPLTGGPAVGGLSQR